MEQRQPGALDHIEIKIGNLNSFQESGEVRNDLLNQLKSVGGVKQHACKKLDAVQQVDVLCS